MKITLLIPTYNWSKALNLNLKSVLQQSVMPSEIVFADDGSKQDTFDVIDKYRKLFSIPLHHVWHEDIGFRKTLILNKAFKKSSGDYIVQADGDLILHKHFIKDHIDNAREGYFIKGSRASLTKDKSEQILSEERINISSFEKGVKAGINATRFPLLSPLFYGNPNDSSNAKGCNFAVWRKDFVAVNGYNNKINGWGHEDIEFAARLVNMGIKHKQLKMTAVCYHLFHEYSSRHNERLNFKLYEDVVNNKIKYCDDGLAQS